MSWEIIRVVVVLLVTVFSLGLTSGIARDARAAPTCDVGATATGSNFYWDVDGTEYGPFDYMVTHCYDETLGSFCTAISYDGAAPNGGADIGNGGDFEGYYVDGYLNYVAFGQFKFFNDGFIIVNGAPDCLAPRFSGVVPLLGIVVQGYVR